MAFTQQDVDRLKRAIATGARIVRYQDREVTYQTTDSMMKALTMMQREVSGTGVIDFLAANYDKGLDHTAGGKVGLEYAE